MTIYQDQINTIFSCDGALKKVLPGYEARKPQLDMAQLVASCLEDQNHGMIQAGVGTGKSLGYLIPASLYAVENNKRIIISTNTKDLQNQLMNKDLPLVQKILAENNHGLVYCDAKGQSNYLCLHKLYDLNERLDSEVLQKMIQEVESNPAMKGDVNSFSFDIPYDVWKQVMKDSNDCQVKENPLLEGCFFKNARTDLKFSHIVIVNHAIFFSDLNQKSKGYNGVLPEYDFVIFDEAHRIEEVYSNFWRDEFSYQMVEDLLQPLKIRKLKWLKEIAKGYVLVELLKYRDLILNDIDYFLKSVHKNLTAQDLKQVILEVPVVAGHHLHYHFTLLRNYLKKLRFGSDITESQEHGINSFRAKLLDCMERIDIILSMDLSNEWAYWIDTIEHSNPARQIVFKSVPYEPKTALKHLYSNSKVIFTSGTIAPGGDFSYAARKLGLTDFESLDVKSPFDYYNQSLIVIPKNSDLAYDPLQGLTAYYDKLCDVIREIMVQTKGSTFILFTSYDAIGQVQKRISSWLTDQGYEGFYQVPGTNRDKLLADYIKSDHGVLFGGESFWEGIDVPGDNLKCVVIIKLPFPNPMDPLTKARTLKLERDGHNSFREMSIPVAILKLTQGAGRLIRTSSDRGVIVILDNRLIHKKYGDQIIRSLPNSRRSFNIEDIEGFLDEGK